LSIRRCTGNAGAGNAGAPDDAGAPAPAGGANFTGRAGAAIIDV